jgi:hypothetical protein
MNIYLKEIGKMAGIDEMVSKTSSQGSKRKTETCLKYEKITSHTARRSFATNAYLAGVPTLAIIKKPVIKPNKPL